ncbi:MULTISPECIES: hypothetical protein [Corynebacterium]|uniref:hypothetical protein n=1 Tax=Corynebacterium TaxID=1716 RepID=UPI001658D4C3|nr:MULTISPECIES: hypothetical protein [Corynebacterium]QNP91596.1 hypothetical protein IAU67_05950 [Corynebacterium zhongnanshanii]
MADAQPTDTDQPTAETFIVDDIDESGIVLRDPCAEDLECDGQWDPSESDEPDTLNEVDPGLEIPLSDTSVIDASDFDFEPLADLDEETPASQPAPDPHQPDDSYVIPITGGPSHNHGHDHGNVHGSSARPSGHKPGGSDKIGKPTKPSKPSNPDKPAMPDKPSDKPAKPEKPAKPSKPSTKPRPHKDAPHRGTGGYTVDSLLAALAESPRGHERVNTKKFLRPATTNEVRRRELEDLIEQASTNPRAARQLQRARARGEVVPKVYTGHRDDELRPRGESWAWSAQSAPKKHAPGEPDAAESESTPGGFAVLSHGDISPLPRTPVGFLSLIAFLGAIGLGVAIGPAMWGHFTRKP